MYIDKFMVVYIDKLLLVEVVTDSTDNTVVGRRSFDACCSRWSTIVDSIDSCRTCTARAGSSHCINSVAGDGATEAAAVVGCRCIHTRSCWLGR